MGGRNHWVLFSSVIEIFFFRRSLRARQGLQCLCLYEWKRGCVPPGAGGAGVAWVRKIVYGIGLNRIVLTMPAIYKKRI